MPLTELEQVNAIVGLGMRIDGWPSTFADLGYVLDRIELKFKIADPKRPGFSIYINPDILFVDDVRNFSFITELKSGRFQDFKQLDRFVNLKPIDLIRYGGVPVRDQSQALAHKISVAEIINEEFLDEYRSEFMRVKHKAQLVTIGPSEIKCHHGKLADSKLDNILKQGISLIGFHRPTKLVPVLPTSDDEYALTSSVVNAIKQLWLRNTRFIASIDVGTSVFRQLWDRFDREAQGRYLKIAKDVINDLAQTELHPYIRPVANERDKWALLQLPDGVADRQRTRASQQFGDAIQRYKWRSRNNTPYEGRRHPSHFSFEDVPGFLPGSEEKAP
jgi:hypothetical protein